MECWSILDVLFGIQEIMGQSRKFLKIGKLWRYSKGKPTFENIEKMAFLNNQWGFLEFWSILDFLFGIQEIMGQSWKFLKIGKFWRYSKGEHTLEFKKLWIKVENFRKYVNF